MRKLRLREVKISPQNTQPRLELSQAKEMPPSVDVSEMRRVAKGSGIQ
jgi:hypothetical protein